MSAILTPEVLLLYGFEELEEKDIIDRPIYRLSNIEGPWGSYGFNIEIVLSPEYLESNPNSGIVSIHMPAFTSIVIPEDLWAKHEWTEEDQIRADGNLVPFEEQRQPIAWHVIRLERLKDIVKSLTLKELEYGK